MFKKLLLASLLITLIGCATHTPQRTMSIITSATNLSYHYTNGDIVTFVGNADLTDLELTSVLEALDQIDRSSTILKYYRDNPDELILNIQDVTFQYTKVKSSYLSIRNVVLNNLDEYSPQEIRTFIEFDNAANVLDKEVELLLESVEANAAVNTALQFANTVIRIGALL